MEKYWDMTIDFFAKINGWIPLVAVLFAGAGLLGIVLVLAITGCVLRKQMVPHWAIWTYFTFATIVIFAHASDLATVIAYMEVPVLVVLLCYIMRTLIARRPLYTFVKESVYARAVAQGRVVEPKDDTENAEGREVENTAVDADGNEKDEQHKHELAVSRKEQRKAEKAAREYEQAAREAERAAREAEEKAAAEKERADREIAAARKAAQEKADAEKERAEREIAAAKKAAEAKAAQNNTKTTTSTATFNLPVVEPIPGKTYTATSEPTITVTPVSETMPDLKMPNTTIQLRYTSNNNRTTTPRPTTSATSTTSTTSAVTARPTTTTTTTVTPNRTVTTETTTTPLNAYTQMYNPRVVKTTTTTTTTTTNTNSNTLNAVSATRTVNGQTTSAAAVKATSTSSTSTTPNSTSDIMAAIERLRASMKK